MNNRSSVIIRGPLGVGKTTVAKLVADKLLAIHVSVDDLLAENRLDFSPDGDGIPVDHFLKINEMIGDIPERPLVVDGNFYYQQQIDDLVERLGPTKVFTLTVPLEVCIERDAQRANPHGADGAKAVYKMVAKVEAGTQIDASNPSIEKVAELILLEVDKR